MAIIDPLLPNLYLIALVGAFLICLCAMQIGRAMGVLDHPDAGRKLHHLPTPLVGGIAILVPLFFWCLAIILSGMLDHSILRTILLCGTGVSLIGFADDQSNTSPFARTASLAPFLAIAISLDPRLVSTTLNWGNFAPTAISFWPCVLLLSLALVGLINSVNMADGQNGISLSMFITWSGCLALVGVETISAIALVILLTSICVLGFNLNSKLFLGDCGSYGVSFVIGILTIAAHNQGHLSIETLAVWFFIPMVDCLRLIISRSLKGGSPFKGDRNHFHHHLSDRMGKNWGLILYAGAVATSSLVSTLAPELALGILALLATFYCSFAWLTIKTREEDNTPDIDDNLIVLNKKTRANDA
jgi:UDP-GlcNAc:undecaprenyl-phosphate GlcNAc-1-phosphate transferase